MIATGDPPTAACTPNGDGTFTASVTRHYYDGSVGHGEKVISEPGDHTVSDGRSATASFSIDEPLGGRQCRYKGTIASP